MTALKIYLNKSELCFLLKRDIRLVSLDLAAGKIKPDAMNGKGHPLFDKSKWQHLEKTEPGNGR